MGVAFCEGVERKQGEGGGGGGGGQTCLGVLFAPVNLPQNGRKTSLLYMLCELAEAMVADARWPPISVRPSIIRGAGSRPGMLPEETRSPEPEDSALTARISRRKKYSLLEQSRSARLNRPDHPPYSFANELRLFLLEGVPLFVFYILKQGVPPFFTMVVAGHTPDSAKLQASLGFGRTFYNAVTMMPMKALTSYYGNSVPGAIGAHVPSAISATRSDLHHAVHGSANVRGLDPADPWRAGCERGRRRRVLSADGGDSVAHAARQPSRDPLHEQPEVRQ